MSTFDGYEIHPNELFSDVQDSRLLTSLLINVNLNSKLGNLLNFDLRLYH